ncbi:thermonuclease family protein [Priestia sp. YIM B13551]|uniref:thermonuclease family protein n=1 Tax=Priestia sp. YIM B13551 TaxID=3366306 RepID=UPI00366BC151
MLDLYNYKATVIEVKDGDTYVISVDLGFRFIHEMELRMLRIDTPETKRYPGRFKYDEEIPIGKQIGQWVRNRILGKEVEIKTQLDESDKYGRVLAELYYEVDGQWINLNQQMLDLGFDKKNIQEKLESSTTIEIPA